jgi:DNA-binding FrmR family transcriptional regulator
MVEEMKADREKVELLLKTAKGQLDGILKMVEEDRYCMDISNQILAVTSILNKINREIIRAHMQHCVKKAFQSGGEEEKIAELIALFDKMAK